MSRGEVWLVQFESAVGGEIRKTRPAVILSNDAANRHLNRVQVAPFTGNVIKVYPGEALVTMGGNQSKALASQIATVSKQRLIRRIGRLVNDDLKAVERAVSIQLGLGG